MEGGYTGFDRFDDSRDIHPEDRDKRGEEPEGESGKEFHALRDVLGSGAVVGGSHGIGFGFRRGVWVV